MTEEIMNNKRKWYEFDSAMLHILAMVLMLCDHTWSTLLPNQEWLTCLGRIAYPIFAFMIVEGYYHTHNLKKYMKRMILFALISEIPFDMMYDGAAFYPYHQNVMWTFLIALCGMYLMDLVREKTSLCIAIPACALIMLACVLLGFACYVDYYGHGIFIVFIFYLFYGKNGRKWWHYVGQFVLMYYLNIEILGGYYYPITIFGKDFELIQQSFALIALIPIWLYRGKQGYHSKPFQYFCYSFYAVHMFILVGIGHLLFT